MHTKTKLSIPLVAMLGACATATEQESGPGRPVQVTTTDLNLVPAGTEFAITVDQEIDTRAPSVGGAYPAHFSQAIINETGREIVPEGSPAELTVISANEAGRLGTQNLVLAIQSVNVNGTPYMITTGTEEAEGKEGLGINKRTGIFVGGGAALGTALGAVIGGVRGAIIGGVLGGAAGAATQVITRGDRVKVPAGTVLEFRLDDDWRLMPQHQYERPIS